MALHLSTPRKLCKATGRSRTDISGYMIPAHYHCTSVVTVTPRPNEKLRVTNCGSVHPLREFVERNPRPDSVTEFFNRVVELAEGDMVDAVNMARLVNYLFGSLEVDESYFEKLNSYLAENEKSPLYTRKGR